MHESFRNVGERGSTTHSTTLVEEETLLPYEVGKKPALGQLSYYHDFSNPVTLWQQGRRGRGFCFTLFYILTVLVSLAWIGLLGLIIGWISISHLNSPCDLPLATYNLVFAGASLSVLLLSTLCAGLMPIRKRPVVVTAALLFGSMAVFAWFMYMCARVLPTLHLGGAPFGWKCDQDLYHYTTLIIIGNLICLGTFVAGFICCCTGRSLGLMGEA